MKRRLNVGDVVCYVDESGVAYVNDTGAIINNGSSKLLSVLWDDGNRDDLRGYSIPGIGSVILIDQAIPVKV